MSDPVAPAVRVAYELTFDEFAEAATGTPPQKAGASKAWSGLIGWVLFVGLAITLVNLQRPDGTTARPTADPEPAALKSLAQRHVIALVPVGLFSALWTFFFVQQLRRPTPKPWTVPAGGAAAKPPARTAGLVGWLIFVALAVALVFLLRERPPRPQAGGRPAPPAWEMPRMTDPDLYLPLAAAGVLVVPSVVAVLWSSRRALRKTWDGQGTLCLPTTLEASDAGVTATDPTCRAEFRWAHFLGFRETPNLLVLYPSALLLRIVPKRAFASAADLDRFKALLQNHVPEGQFLAPPEPPGFAVLPVKPVRVGAPGGTPSGVGGPPASGGTH